jgi:AsmA protein
MKILKYLWVLAGLAVLAIVAIAIFALSFDPNRYKPQIERLVKERTGRTLKLQGDIRVAVFPSLGADVAKATLSERVPGQEFLSLDSAHASVALLPLLRGEVIVDRIRVSGLHAHVVKDRNGHYNFDDLLQAGNKGEKAPAPAQEGKGKGEVQGGVQFDIAGFSMDHSSIAYEDLGTGKALSLTDVKLATGRIAEQADGKLEIAANVKGRNPALEAHIDLGTGYHVDLPAQSYALSGLDGAVQGTLGTDQIEAKITAPRVAIGAGKAAGEAVNGQFSLKGPERSLQASVKLAGIEGSAKALAIPSMSAELSMSGAGMAKPLKIPVSGSVRADLEKQSASADLTSKLDESNIKAKLGLTKFSPPAYTFDIDVDRLNLDQYFPPAQPAGGQPPSGGEAGKAAPTPDTPVDLSALKDLSASGRLQFGALQVKGLKLANLKAQVRAANGRLEVSPHSASLYEGTLSGVLSAQADGNRISLKETLNNVSVGPLLRDVAQQDRLEGRGNVALDVSGAGATVNAIKKSLDGTARMNLRDGAIKGINIAEILRKAKAALGSEAAQAANDQEKTDFTELNASFTIRNGIAHNQDLDMKSPLVRVTGAGDINIGTSSLDYTVKAAVVASAKGQGGKELEELAGLSVPVKLSGPFDALKYDVDYRSVAGELAKSKVGGKVKEKLEQKKGKVEEKLRDQLKGLLGR